MNKKELKALDHYNKWIMFRNEIISDNTQSLNKINIKLKITDTTRILAMDLGLIFNLNSNAPFPRWSIVKDPTQEEFIKMYSDLLSNRSQDIYVFNSENKIVYSSKIKQDVINKYGVTSKTLYTLIKNKKLSRKGFYFSFDKDFKIPVSKPVQRIEKISRVKNHIGSHEEKSINRMSALEVLQLAKSQNKRCVSANKLGVDGIRRKLKTK